MQISTAPESSIETFYGRAITISDSEAVFMLQCGLDNPSTCSLTVTCGTTVKRISMGNFSGFLQATDMTDAISKSRSPSGYKDLVIVNNSAKPNQFTLFMIFNKGTATEITYRSKRNTGTSFKVLADNSKTNIVTDYGFKDMVKTILALERMPNTVSNPVTYTGSLAAIDDNKQEKLMASAILFHSLAHNSPIENRNEVEQGVFSNYIQFADSVVRSWGTIGTTASGFERLEEIYELVLAQNKGDLIDPIYVRNNGTLSDYGKPIKERKNFAFYEGYTRLDVDLEYSPGGSSTLTGAGVVFRVSDNIEVYEANLADTFNMFEEPFIPCTTGSRRIIIAANDSLLGKLATDGIWVKGYDQSKGEQQYYTGISKTRLPLQSVAGAKLVKVAFALAREAAETNDPVGTIVGGIGKNILKSKVLQNNGLDTLIYKNSSVLLHGEQRWLEYDTNYIKTKVFFVKRKEDSAKVVLEPSGYGVKIIDKSPGDKITVNGFGETTINGEKKLTHANEYTYSAYRLLFKDAVANKLELICSGEQELKTAIETNIDNILPEGDRGDIIVVDITGAPGVEIYKGNSGPDIKIFPPKKEITKAEIPWDDFRAKFLTGASNLFFKSLPGGKLEVKIYPKKNQQLGECLTIYHNKVKDIRWFKQIEVTDEIAWDRGKNLILHQRAHIGESNKNMIRFELELINGVPEKMIRDNLDVTLQLQGGNNGSYPENLVNIDIYKKGILIDGARMNVQGNLVRFWNVNINEIINKNIDLTYNSRYSIDIVSEERQSLEDSEKFGEYKLTGVNHYEFGRTHVNFDPINCIAMSNPFPSKTTSYEDCGLLFLQVVPHNDQNIGIDKKFIYPKSSKWFMFSGHNHTYKSGFDLDAKGSMTFKLSHSYQTLKWNTTEMIIINACHALSVKDLEEGKVPNVDISNEFCLNNGLQWLEIPNVHVVLGYGSCKVKKTDGTIKVYGTGMSESPTDCNGHCNGKNSWTQAMMDKFLKSIDGITDNSEIAKKWVEAAITTKIPRPSSNSYQNAIGIGVITNGTNRTNFVFAYDPITMGVEESFKYTR